MKISRDNTSNVVLIRRMRVTMKNFAACHPTTVAYINLTY